MGLVAFNPTNLKVGKTGVLDGRPATVVGRAVLSSIEGYRWHEYYVDLAGGKTAILVFESGIWKRFDAFNPPTAYTARDAMQVRVGDFVPLGVEGAKVNYRSWSKVLYGEGTLLEGECKGSKAQYFNAEGDDEMLVVSWTGDEIEFYRGRKLPPATIRQAFNLSPPSVFRLLLAGSGGLSSSSEVPPMTHLLWIGVILLLAIGPEVAANINWNGGPVEPPPMQAAPARRLRVGAEGGLEGLHYRVTAHWLEEIDSPGTRCRRDEYELQDDEGKDLLLIQGLNGDPHEWCLLHFLAAPPGLTPLAAAKLKSNASLDLAGRAFLTRALFRSETLNADGPAAKGRTIAAVRYGWVARDPNGWALARWNELQLELAVGVSVPESIVLSSLGPVVPR